MQAMEVKMLVRCEGVVVSSLEKAAPGGCRAGIACNAQQTQHNTHYITKIKNP